MKLISLLHCKLGDNNNSHTYFKSSNNNQEFKSRFCSINLPCATLFLINGNINAKYSIISCSKEGSPKHPSPIVTNSLNRRNMNPHWTKGNLINFRAGSAPLRQDIVSIEKIPFFYRVEIPND